MQPTGLRTTFCIGEAQKRHICFFCFTVMSNVYIQPEEHLADSNMQLVL